MNTYLMAAKDANEELDRELKSRFGGHVLRLAENQWLVSARMTTRQVTEKIDPGKGGKWGEFVVVKFGNYSGWHDMDTWEWIEEMRQTAPWSAANSNG